MDNQKQTTYPKKNWGSFMIFNKSKVDLTFEKVFSMSLQELHQFKWCDENDIGELPLKWNWLVGEYEDIDDANALHYTLGGAWYDKPHDSKLNDIWLSYSRRQTEEKLNGGKS